MKLDLVLENTRNKYTLGLLEESSLSEVESLLSAEAYAALIG